MSYTKGPLRISGPSQGGLNDDAGDYAIIESGGIIIGEAFHCIGENAWRDAEANARLWAKAPDLLAALEIIVREGDPATAIMDWPTAELFAGWAIEQAQDALVGARGEESKS